MMSCDRHVKMIWPGRLSPGDPRWRGSSRTAPRAASGGRRRCCRGTHGHEAQPAPAAEVQTPPERAIELLERTHGDRVDHLLVELRIRLGGLQAVLHGDVGVVQIHGPEPHRRRAGGVHVDHLDAPPDKADGHLRSVGSHTAHEFESSNRICTVTWCSPARAHHRIDGIDAQMPILGACIAGGHFASQFSGVSSGPQSRAAPPHEILQTWRAYGSGGRSCAVSCNLAPDSR